MFSKQLTWVRNLFPNGGYFVEAGAHDGIGDSQTKCFEDLGTWKGICVEPSSAFNGLHKNRKCHVDNRCLWKYSGLQVAFREISGNSIELSGIISTLGDSWDRKTHPYQDLWKQAVSLTDLLTEYNAPSFIEFLVLDTEGSEYDILKAHDFAKFLFGFMFIEHGSVEPYRTSIRELLNSHGYNIYVEEEANDYYIHSSISTH